MNNEQKQYYYNNEPSYDSVIPNEESRQMKINESSKKRGDS
ncbi:MAG: hypothetical protein R2685_03975 [Candidatus Nitrosocosmicus sp.]